MMIGACHSFAVDGPVVKRYWPEYYRSGESDGSAGEGEEQAAS